MPSIQCAQPSNRFTVFLYSPTISYQLEAEHLDLKSYYILKLNLDSSFAVAARTEQNMYAFRPSVTVRPAIYLRNLFRRQVVNDVCPQPEGSHGPNVPHTHMILGRWVLERSARAWPHIIVGEGMHLQLKDKRCLCVA